MERNPKKRTEMVLAKFNKLKRCAIYVKDRSETNLLSAMTIAITKLREVDKAKFFWRNQTLREMHQKRTTFLNAATHALGRVPVTLEDYQELLVNEAQIICWGQNSNFNVEFKGANQEKQIYLIRDKFDIYDVITNPGGYFKTHYYCKKCAFVGNNKAYHWCGDSCKKCNSETVHEKSEVGPSYCIECRRF